MTKDSLVRRLSRLPAWYLFVAAPVFAAISGASVLSGAHPTTGRAYESTYVPLPSHPILFRAATILTGRGDLLLETDLLIKGGRIAAIGKDLASTSDVTVINARGRWLTPGLIDIHSHLGDNPSPQTKGNSDGNEMSSPNTANVRAEDSVWTQDPGFSRALAGGVTTLQILPGSSNLFGGRTVVLKNVPAVTVQAMKFPGAPYGLKMACGENPARLYRERHETPTSRMGELAYFRKIWSEATEYRRSGLHTVAHAAGNPPTSPADDLSLATLAGVLSGEILVHIHCYRSDDLANMIELAKEFNYKIAAFHHATEAYKVAPALVSHGICAAVWSDWWGSKMETYDAIPENAAILTQAGGCAIIHSDSELDVQRLNQEAAKAMAAGQRAGLDIRPARAIQWITFNAAKALGIEGQTGSLEVGKAADVVLWSGTPFSVYTLADSVLIDGAVVFDRKLPQGRPVRDFELGQPALRGDDE